MNAWLKLTGVIILAILMLLTSCSSIPTSISIPRAIANIGQPFDISIWSLTSGKSSDSQVNIITFRVRLKPNDRTAKNTTYVVSLISDGKTAYTQNVTVPTLEQWSAQTGMKGEDQFNRIWSKDIDLVLKYPYNDANSTGRRLLADLADKIRNAQTAYDDLEAKMSWDLVRGAMGNKSYEEVKALQEQERKLQEEVQKWNVISKGGNLIGNQPWLDDLNNFCSKYVRITVDKAK